MTISRGVGSKSKRPSAHTAEVCALIMRHIVDADERYAAMPPNKFARVRGEQATETEMTANSRYVFGIAT
jgi:hypothetical protein